MFQPKKRKQYLPSEDKPLDVEIFKYDPNGLYLRLSLITPKFYGYSSECALNHLNAFYGFLHAYKVDLESHAMRLFVRTLKDFAMEAFDLLPTQSISSWEELKKWFIDNFHNVGNE